MPPSHPDTRDPEADRTREPTDAPAVHVGAGSEPTQSAPTVVVPAAPAEADPAAAMLSAIPDWVYLVDREARVVHANRALCAASDGRLPSAEPQTFQALGLAQGDALRLASAVERAARDGTPVTVVTAGTGARGAKRRMEHVLSPVATQDGAVRNVAGVARERFDDVEHERERLREIVELSPAVMTVLRGPDLVYELTNARWHDLAGPRDVLGKPLRQAIPELAGQGYVELLERVYATGEPFIGNEMPVLLRRTEGGPLERRTVNLVYQPLREADGTVSGIFAHGVDVTDLVAARETLRAGEANLRRSVAEASAANAAKDRIIGMLSHELRTPLEPLAAAAAALEADSRVPLDLREEAATIRRNVELETRLIDDLLELSRVIRGDLRLEQRPTRVHDVVRHVLECAGPELARHGIAVDVQLAATHDVVDADPARLQQVFTNLIDNVSRQAAPGVRASVRSSFEHGELVLVVTDSGAGIEPSLLPRIFDPFAHEGAGSRSGRAGLGLGLVMAKAVIELHGGSIAAASEGAGRGSTFTVRLPGSSKRFVPAAPSPAPRSRAGLRVLLVEDHEDTLRTVSRLLDLEGFRVEGVSTVARAVALALRERFDVVVSDLTLPDGSGHELLSRIRQGVGATPASVPAIATSGYATESDLRQSRASGFAAHLVKPVSMGQLCTAIRAVTAPA